MNLNLRKSVLLVGALASLGLSYTTEALATSPNFAVNSVQQSKKVTGNDNLLRNEMNLDSINREYGLC